MFLNYSWILDDLVAEDDMLNKFKYRKQKCLLNNRCLLLLSSQSRHLTGMLFSHICHLSSGVISPFSPSCSSLKISMLRAMAGGIFAASSVKSLPHTSQELQEKKKGVRTEFPFFSLQISSIPKVLLFAPNIFLIHSLLYPLQASS